MLHLEAHSRRIIEQIDQREYYRKKYSGLRALLDSFSESENIGADSRHGRSSIDFLIIDDLPISRNDSGSSDNFEMTFREFPFFLMDQLFSGKSVIVNILRSKDSVISSNLKNFFDGAERFISKRLLSNHNPVLIIDLDESSRKTFSIATQTSSTTKRK